MSLPPSLTPPSVYFLSHILVLPPCVSYFPRFRFYISPFSNSIPRRFYQASTSELYGKVQEVIITIMIIIIRFIISTINVSAGATEREDSLLPAESVWCGQIICILVSFGQNSVLEIFDCNCNVHKRLIHTQCIECKEE